MIRALAVLAAGLALLVARDAVAGVPTDQLRGSIDLVLKIVTDPELKKVAKTEGISLIGNYRTQFNAVIQRSGYLDLVAKLTAKRDERPGAREAGRQEAAAPAAAGTPLPPHQSP